MGWAEKDKVAKDLEVHTQEFNLQLLDKMEA